MDWNMWVSSTSSRKDIVCLLPKKKREKNRSHGSHCRWRLFLSCLAHLLFLLRFFASHCYCDGVRRNTQPNYPLTPWWNVTVIFVPLPALLVARLPMANT